MKRPLLNQFERHVIREVPDSFYTDRLKASLAISHFKRELTRTWYFKQMEKFVDWLNKKLS